ncbi:hypothetical protein K491DRAFT_84202 [Lophiostoma macrostomum CBS 122681]|uniref:Zinc finger PHD-type domain-containing protein n=1 Tax=Lophiostoma macrostomum CBS 122681 TaxID=1314788 RepID=A0A6A6SZK5_9PLEO|nr:hypothetical protein K491DRAFT_84202 [Lophiostoma macrostomum CBS 122681]
MHAAPSYDFDDTEELMPGLQSGKITDQQHDGGPPGRVYNAILENVLKTATLAPAQESSVASKVPIGAQDRMSNSSMPQATSVSSLASNAPLLSRPALPQHLVPKPIYCYCQRPDNGSRMVQCTNENCSVQWVHLQCMNKAQRLSTKHRKYISLPFL